MVRMSRQHDEPMRCAASPLLRPGSHDTLARYRARYPEHYDDVFWEVHARLHKNGFATKLDLDVLITWKHVRTATWMRTLNQMKESEVKEITENAFGMPTADQLVAAMRKLPGFGARGAFTSALSAAWEPTQFGVYDRFAVSAHIGVVSDRCACAWDDLSTYQRHLRVIADELSTDPSARWSPRDVDMALYGIGWTADATARTEARHRRREAKKAQRGRIS